MGFFKACHQEKVKHRSNGGGLLGSVRLTSSAFRHGSNAASGVLHRRVHQAVTRQCQ
jgi:hypothetical protein